MRTALKKHKHSLVVDCRTAFIANRSNKGSRILHCVQIWTLDFVLVLKSEYWRLFLSNKKFYDQQLINFCISVLHVWTQNCFFFIIRSKSDSIFENPTFVYECQILFWKTYFSIFLHLLLFVAYSCWVIFITEVVVFTVLKNRFVKKWTNEQKMLFSRFSHFSLMTLAAHSHWNSTVISNHFFVWTWSNISDNFPLSSQSCLWARNPD